MHVSLINFPEIDGSKLQKILQLSKTSSYSVSPFNPDSETDLWFFYGENYFEKEEFKCLSERHYSRVIVVAKQAPQTGCHHLALPLIASRSLKLLDKITDAALSLKTENTSAQSRQNGLQAYREDSESDFRILVVDDSEPMQQALAKEIKNFDAAAVIDFADNGEQALEIVKNRHYDFIFLDIIMPGIDGFETCTRMRKLPQLKKTPIVMLSSKTSPLDEVKGVMAGCTTYMTKPIVPEEFQKVIRRISKWVENVAKKKLADTQAI